MHRGAETLMSASSAIWLIPLEVEGLRKLNQFFLVPFHGQERRQRMGQGPQDSFHGSVLPCPLPPSATLGGKAIHLARPVGLLDAVLWAN